MLRRFAPLTPAARALLPGSAAPAAPAVAGAVGHSAWARWLATHSLEVPGMPDSITEGDVMAVLKSVGEYVEADEIVIQVATDKVTLDVTAPVGGTLTEVLVAEDDTVAEGQAVATVEEGDAPEGAAPAAAPADEPAAAAPAATPAAETPAAAAPAAATPKPAAATPAPVVAAPVAGSRAERREKTTRMRRRIAQRLKDSQNTAAMLTTFQECDMSALMALRARHKDAFLDKHGVKLGFMSGFIAASAAALVEMPVVNAVISDDSSEVIYRDYVDVSIAVSTPTGLVVPPLRDAHLMNFAEIEAGVVDLGQRARDGTLSIDDMSGGTFTISNGGVYGSMLGTPIINPPQSAILGMHGIKQRPVVVDGEVTIRPMMYLALTYDHRQIDGREAVTFLCSIRDKVEDPARLLLGL